MATTKTLEHPAIEITPSGSAIITPMQRSFVLCLVMLCGCGASTSPLVEGAELGATDARDAGIRDAGLAPDSGPTPTGLVFRLSFRSDVGGADAIYAQESTSSREGPGWLSVRTSSGAPLELVGRCDLCECSASSTSCSSCPRCGPPPDLVRALSGSGEVIEHHWDLLVHETGTCDAGELALCAATPTLALPGDYVATFCWSDTSTGVGLGQTIGASSCQDVPFRLPDEDGVVEDAVCFCG